MKGSAQHKLFGNLQIQWTKHIASKRVIVIMLSLVLSACGMAAPQAFAGLLIFGKPTAFVEPGLTAIPTNTTTPQQTVKKTPIVGRVTAEIEESIDGPLSKEFVPEEGGANYTLEALEVPLTKTPHSPGNPDPENRGELFFSTEFEEADHWYSFSLPEEAKYTAGLDRGVLYLQVPETFSNVYVFYEMELINPDVRLETVVENVGGPNTNNISLVCRANKNGWYEFSITSGGYWHIWKLANGEYVELATGPSRTINQKRSKNALSATCIGSQLTLYVNYRKIGEARDRTFLDGGQVGVGVSTFGLPSSEIDFALFQASVP